MFGVLVGGLLRFCRESVRNPSQEVDRLRPLQDTLAIVGRILLCFRDDPIAGQG